MAIHTRLCNVEFYTVPLRQLNLRSLTASQYFLPPVRRPDPRAKYVLVLMGSGAGVVEEYLAKMGDKAPMRAHAQRVRVPNV